MKSVYTQEEIKPVKKRVWSKYQQAIYDKAVQDTESNVMINACAGGAKTSTGLHIFSLLPNDIKRNSIAVAFNKHIQVEFQSKLPEGSKAVTYHSLGFSAVRACVGDVKVDEYKIDNIIKNKVGPYGKFMIGSIKRLIGLCKSAVIEDIYSINLNTVAMDYDIDLFDERDRTARDTIIECVQYAYKKSAEMMNVIDFDDMCFLPVYHNMPLKQYRFIVGDEQQDCSSGQAMLLTRSIGDSGRLYALGDPHQCQPEGTLVKKTTKRLPTNRNKFSYVPIESLVVGDSVATPSIGESVVYSTGEVKAISKREYNGDLICVKTQNHFSRYTPNHRCLANFNSFAGKHFVYLMRKGEKFRVGKSMIRTNQGNIRMNQEQADALWILGFYETNKDAMAAEQAISGKFGIPQLMFSDINKTVLVGVGDYIWGWIGDLTDRAVSCLSYFGRDIKYPLFQHRDLCNGKLRSLKRPQEVYACNLIDGVLVLDLGDKNVFGKSDWVPASITREAYSGIVVSLQVGKFGTYVADGIATHNSIYRWRGAGENAMSDMKALLHADEMPLSITYRCPKKVVELVNIKFPNIKFEGAEWAKDGKVENIKAEQVEDLTHDGDMILCRVNADLVPTAFSLIRKGIKATVRGRDIGKGLTSLIKKVGGSEIPDMKRNILTWRDDEVKKLYMNDRAHLVSHVQDKVDTILAIADNANSIPDLLAKCDTLFSDDVNGVVLSSIHKAKGLEAERVFILRPDLLPHPAAKSAVDKQQENNLLYVSITRSKNELYWCY